MDTKEIRRRNLQALMEDQLFTHPNLGKAGFAEKIGVAPAQLSQLTGMNAVRSIGDMIARRIEQGLDLPHGWMDSPQWEKLTGFGLRNRLTPSANQSSGLGSESMNAYRIDLLDTEFSCGNGRLNSDFPEVVKSIEIEPEEAKRMFGGRQSAALKITTAVGDSMLGTIAPGDLVVMDITVKRFLSDGIYGFVFGDNFHIKRLQSLRDKLVVISDNTTYERWYVTDEDESQFFIQGLVVGKWQMNYTRLG